MCILSFLRLISYQPECGKAWTCCVVINCEWRYVGKCLLSLHQFENLGLKYIGKSQASSAS